MLEGPTGRSRTVEEGGISLPFPSGGHTKGPAARAAVFYNPAMRPNRDISVLAMQALVDLDLLPGKGEVRILDGLCGTGVRAMRFAREVRWGDLNVSMHACDSNRRAIETGERVSVENGSDVVFHTQDIRRHLEENRYSYIDIDPFGSPVPFLTHALDSIIPKGVIAITATDTAALCGSVPRVTRRRYGSIMVKTEYLKEVSCRVLMGSFARLAATLETSLEPLFFFASDHYVRGMVRVVRGARRADDMLGNIDDIVYDPPGMPARALNDNRGNGTVLGPIWLGPLEDPALVRAMFDRLGPDRLDAPPLKGSRQVSRMLEMALSEHDLPPFGYDTDRIASHLRTSPPPSSRIIDSLMDIGIPASRSRFGDKIIRTEADRDTISRLFQAGD